LKQRTITLRRRGRTKVKNHCSKSSASNAQHALRAAVRHCVFDLRGPIGMSGQCYAPTTTETAPKALKPWKVWFWDCCVFTDI